jgi:hypothetical protein
MFKKLYEILNIIVREIQMLIEIERKNQELLTNLLEELGAANWEDSYVRAISEAYKKREELAKKWSQVEPGEREPLPS